ncbi:MAG: hypothetical protein ACKPJJ_24415, partial [Planctomycetaceae bacterium]
TSLRLGGNSHPQQQQLIQAAQDMQAGKSEQAIGSLEALSDGLVPDGLQQAAVFLLAENQRRSGQSARAEQRYRQLCETVDGTAFSRLALHQMVCLQQQVTGLDGDMRFCGQNLPYDQAMTEYRREL